jgi:hypothetical protein
VCCQPASRWQVGLQLLRCFKVSCFLLFLLSASPRVFKAKQISVGMHACGDATPFLIYPAGTAHPCVSYQTDSVSSRSTLIR